MTLALTINVIILGLIVVLATHQSLVYFGIDHDQFPPILWTTCNQDHRDGDYDHAHFDHYDYDQRLRLTKPMVYNLGS